MTALLDYGPDAVIMKGLDGRNWGLKDSLWIGAPVDGYLPSCGCAADGLSGRSAARV